MKCVEAKRMINRFVEKKLSYRELEQFLRHVEQCGDCMDELDIYFTMHKAFDMLDKGAHQNYNFKEMLENELHTARRAVIVHKISLVLRAALCVALTVLLFFGVYFLILHR